MLKVSILMKTKGFFMMYSLLLVCLFSVMFAGCGNSGVGDKKVSSGSISGTLNVAVAGDTNMTELMTKDVNPMFQDKVSKDVKINVFGTGPGDAGSTAIYSKLKAQKDANKDTYDIDVAIVHQSVMDKLIDEDLVEKWLPLVENKGNVVSEDAKNSLGKDVDGYVAPLFHSQVAIAYNSEKINKPFTSFAELENWIKANPNKFGYNGIKNGASGVGFVTGYTYYKTGDYDKLIKGSFDHNLETKWPAVMAELKGLPVTYTNGNNGTLDMLNRGEIDAGPVWVDMFNTWLAQGRINKNVQLCLPSPGLPGQPMYVVIIKKAANRDAALALANFLISKEVQSSVIVEKYNWYPGIDSNVVMDVVSDKAKQNLFKNITADVLNKNAQLFPLDQYFKDLKDTYEDTK